MGTRSLRANSAAAGENSSVLTREAALFRPYINRLRVLSVGQAAELTAEPAEELTGEFATEQRNSSGIRCWTYSRQSVPRLLASISVTRYMMSTVQWETDMADPAERMKMMRARRRGRGLRELRLVVPDARSEAVRNRIAAQVAELSPDSEREALLWIEAVSEFDGDEPR